MVNRIKSSNHISVFEDLFVQKISPGELRQVSELTKTTFPIACPGALRNFPRQEKTIYSRTEGIVHQALSFERSKQGTPFEL